MMSILIQRVQASKILDEITELHPEQTVIILRVAEAVLVIRT